MLIFYYKNQNPTHTKMMEFQYGKDYQSITLKWIEYSKISKSIKRSVIAAEDDNFMNHHGFDWNQIRKAVKENLQSKKIIRGGSTISQQVAKNIFLNPEKRYLRKINEFVLTFFLEMIMSKKRIFEIYLNVIEWGDGIYGLGNAVSYYYKTSVSDLSEYEASKLASMINKPKYYQRNFNSDELNLKTIKIMNRANFTNYPE
jgi:monofunctional biosynthetic peptidoglycan transglycosylase